MFSFAQYNIFAVDHTISSNNKAYVKFSLMTKEFLGISQVCFSVIIFIL